MDLNNFGIMNSLMSILDSQTNDNDKTIAQYIVANARRIGDMGVREIVDGAFVSRSAVRRFCNKLGYQSWNDLKVNFDCNAFPSDLQHRDFSISVDAYRKNLMNSIAEVLLDIDETVTKTDLIRLSRMIYEHEDVLFVCPSNTASALLRFQQEMLYAGKMVHLIFDAYTNRPPDDLADRAITVCVSIMGNFAEAIDSWIDCRPGKKVLITASGVDAALKTNHDVIRISKKAHDQDTLGVYAKYGISYFFDLLSTSYLSLYPYR